MAEAFNWNQFDKKVDLDSIADDLKDIEENGGNDYPEIPDGNYEVGVAAMELGKSKVKDNGTGGDPMLKIRFKILAGEFKGNSIFFNSVMQQPSQETGTFAFQIHNAITMLRDLWDDPKGTDVNWENSFAKLDSLIKDIVDDVVDNEEWDYKLEQKPAKNPAYKQYKILEIFE